VKGTMSSMAPFTSLRVTEETPASA
jgi:hypothetical protein